MKLSDLIKKQTKKVTIDGCVMQFKRLTWIEIQDFDKIVKDITKDSEDDTNQTVEICKYIFETYVTDEDGKMSLKQEDVKSLPVDFCTKVINKFMSLAQGESEESIKKN